MLTSLEHIRMYREGRCGPALLGDNRWLQNIVTAEERIVNLERIQSLQQLANSNPVLDYVERTLQVLDELPLSLWIKETIEEVLKWSETAKGGSVRQRIAWQEQGISLVRLSDALLLGIIAPMRTASVGIGERVPLRQAPCAEALSRQVELVRIGGQRGNRPADIDRRL